MIQKFKSEIFFLLPILVLAFAAMSSVKGQNMAHGLKRNQEILSF